MPVFDGQLILGDITIISVVSCTTFLMCEIFSFRLPNMSGKGVDIRKEDSKTTFGKMKGLMNHSYGISSAFADLPEHVRLKVPLLTYCLCQQC